VLKIDISTIIKLAELCHINIENQLPLLEETPRNFFPLNRPIDGRLALL
jgi:hypothetical protein